MDKFQAFNLIAKAVRGITANADVHDQIAQALQVIAGELKEEKKEEKKERDSKK